jgi:hypothetical protein
MAPESPTEIKPWTIRGIRPEIRNAAIAAAKRDKLELGEWFNRNIPAIIQHIRRQNRMPAVRPEPASVRPEARLSDYEYWHWLVCGYRWRTWDRAGGSKCLRCGRGLS